MALRLVSHWVRPWATSTVSQLGPRLVSRWGQHWVRRLVLRWVQQWATLKAQQSGSQLV